MLAESPRDPFLEVLQQNSLPPSTASSATGRSDRGRAGIAPAENRRLSTAHAKGLTYEYLDGRTRNRQEKVRRFQEDPNCPLFLISLKAGGQGLNLTAADYVYLLDPWWNPAVEAQAIDRAHRIGQDRRVFAYRLICRDTVEERILELQQKKRKLADAIVTADQGLLRELTAEDLQLLLS
jgi:SNF2 family DNA or RNA helicase